MISTTVNPRLSSSDGLPQRLEALANLRVLDRLVIGVDHRDQTRIRGALNIVLTAQRMQPRTRPADLPGDQRKRDQAARIVGAVGVLRYAHAPKDDCRLGPGVCARDMPQGCGVDAADRRHLFRRKVANMFAQLFEIIGVRLHVLPVVEALLDDRMDQRVQHRDVAAGREA